MADRRGLGRLRAWLELPGASGSSLDHPSATLARREVLRKKPFLQKVYRDWYGRMLTALPVSGGKVLELGSGAAFLGEVVPGLVTSEIVAWEGVSMVADARALPFSPDSLRAILMTNVLHHLSDVRAFFREASRCVRPGGVVAMVEPWVTTWSRFVYGRFHDEPFAPEAGAWEFPSTGPLSGANGALPWIVFERDRRTFESEFSEWAIERAEPFMPLRYLLSGGLSLRSLMPGFSHGFWRGAEALLSPLRRQTAMFALVVLRRRPRQGPCPDSSSHATAILSRERSGVERQLM
jgi:SAM-dependent methyltransferase